MILVTGGTGFVGTRVVARFLERDDSVLCFDSQPRSEALDDLASHSNLKIVKGDITNFQNLVRAMVTPAVDHVVHLAAVIGRPLQDDPYAAATVNIQGTLNVLEASRLLGIRRLVYASSMIVYGDQSLHGDTDIDEDSPLFPSSPYAHSKRINEVMAEQYRETCALDAIGLRICTPIGYGRIDGSGAGGAVSTLIGRPARGQAARLALSPEERPPAIHVDDVAEIFVRLATAPSLTRSIYLCSATPASLAEVAAMVRDVLPGAEITLESGGPTIPHVNRISAGRLEADIGYSPPPLRRRMQDLIDEVWTKG